MRMNELQKLVAGPEKAFMTARALTIRQGVLSSRSRSIRSMESSYDILIPSSDSTNAGYARA